MREPWNRKYRLGLNLGTAAPLPNGRTTGLAVGAAVVSTGPNVLSQATAPLAGDPVAAIVGRYREEIAKRPGCEGVTLYRYDTDIAFKASRAADEGMTRGAHTLMIERVARELLADGLDVIIEGVEA